MKTAFLSIEDDQPLSVCCFCSCSMFVVDLQKFLDESLCDMSRSQKLKYRIALTEFCKKLSEEDS